MVNAFLINLDRATDRRNYMIGELDRLMPGLSVERALAIDIKAPDWTPPDRYQPGRWNSDRWSLVPSDIEIFRSHLDCWKRIADSGEAGIVLEDDLLFSDSFADAVLALERSMPDGIVHLDGLDRTVLTGNRQELGAGFAVREVFSLMPSSGCYFIDSKSAATLASIARIERTVDDFLFDPTPTARGARGHGMPILQIEPAVAVQGQFGRFSDPKREVPDFLLVTKRADVSRRCDPQISGPLVFRLRKEVLRFIQRGCFPLRRRRVLADGGSYTTLRPAPDLSWN